MLAPIPVTDKTIGCSGNAAEQWGHRRRQRVENDKCPVRVDTAYLCPPFLSGGASLAKSKETLSYQRFLKFASSKNLNRFAQLKLGAELSFIESGIQAVSI